MKYLLIISLLLVSFNLHSQTFYLSDKENYEHYLKQGGKAIPEVEFALNEAKNKLGSDFSSRMPIVVDENKNFNYGNHADIGCPDTTYIEYPNKSFYMHEKIQVNQVNPSNVTTHSSMTNKPPKVIDFNIEEKAIKDCSPKLNIVTLSKADIILFNQYQQYMEQIDSRISYNDSKEEEENYEDQDESEDEENEEEENNEDQDENEDEENEEEENEGAVTITDLKRKPILHFMYNHANKMKDVISNEAGYLHVDLSKLKKNYLDKVDNKMPGFYLIHSTKYKAHTYYILFNRE